MTHYLIAQGIGAALLWSLFAACYVWNEKAQTFTSFGFSVFTLYVALTFTALGAMNIITMAVAQ
jgi:hypothetical protein